MSHHLNSLFIIGGSELCQNIQYFMKNQTLIREQSLVLLDIVSVTAKCSKFLQNLQNLPWEKIDEFSSIFETFRKMRDCLPLNGEYATSARIPRENGFVELWPNASTCILSEESMVTFCIFQNYYI